MLDPLLGALAVLLLFWLWVRQRQRALPPCVGRVVRCYEDDERRLVIEAEFFDSGGQRLLTVVWSPGIPGLPVVDENEDPDA